MQVPKKVSAYADVRVSVIELDEAAVIVPFILLAHL